MKIVKAHNLACPIDGKRLNPHEKALTCENGHAFDIARQGYVNLLPVQHKRSKQPGDSKAMVVARTELLNSGIYDPIAKKLAEIVHAQITDTQSSKIKEICLLDAGCGEGYYFDYVVKYLEGENCDNDFSFIGLDISKAAIAEATKRNKQVTWIVGTNRQPPVEPASVDMVLCIFGFQSFEGFRKILKPGSKLILVEPGPDHLIELRKIIYREVKASGLQDLAHAEDLGFSIVDSQQLQFKTEAINNDHINSLLIMTPHFYRAFSEGREAASILPKLELTVDVKIRILEQYK